jgi:hypothetical protein
MSSFRILTIALLAVGCTRSTTVNQDMDEAGGSGNSGAASSGGSGTGGTSAQGANGGGARGGASSGSGGSTATGGSDANGGGGGAEPPEPPSSDPGGTVSDLGLSNAEISDAACARNGTGVSCTFTLTGDDQDHMVVLPRTTAVGCPTAAYAYDDRGNRYLAASVSLGSETASGGICSIGAPLIAELPTPVTYEFTDVSENATEITLLHFAPRIDGAESMVKLRRLSFEGSDAELAEPAADGADEFGEPLGSVDVQNVRFRYYACRMSGADAFDCPLTATSLAADRLVRFATHEDAFCMGNATAIDDQAGQHIAARLDVANEVTTGCGFERMLVKGVPAVASYHFEGTGDTSTQIARLQVPLVVDGTTGELSVRDVPLER